MRKIRRDWEAGEWEWPCRIVRIFQGMGSAWVHVLVC